MDQTFMYKMLQEAKTKSCSSFPRVKLWVQHLVDLHSVLVTYCIAKRHILLNYKIMAFKWYL